MYKGLEVTDLVSRCISIAAVIERLKAAFF